MSEATRKLREAPQYPGTEQRNISEIVAHLEQEQENMEGVAPPNVPETPPTMADDMNEILARIVTEHDIRRMSVGTALMNVFNYAIQQQAGRREWIASDFRAFSIALAAIDNIGKREEEHAVLEATKRV